MTITRTCGFLGTLVGSTVAVAGVIFPTLTGAWRGMDVDPVLMSAGAAVLTLGLALMAPRDPAPEPQALIEPRAEAPATAFSHATAPVTKAAA